jgi:hypothetical protein
MDHLPEPSPGSGRPIVVPCLCDPDYYDGLGFDEFPVRKGWVLDRKEYGTSLSRSDGAASSPTETSMILQAWLFFGVLVEAFRAVNIAVDPHEFVQVGREGRFIATHQLPTYLSQWVAKTQTLDEKLRKKQFQNASEILQKALYFSTANFTETPIVRFDNETGKSRAGLAIELSILVLGETLEHTAYYARMGHHRFEKRQSEFESIMSLDPQYEMSDIDVAVSLRRQMLESGWCPSSISMLSLTLGNTGIYFASRLRQRARGRDHGSCSNTKCVTSFIDETTYKTQHTKDCLGCKHVGVSTDYLATMLRDGQLPSISISVQEADDGEGQYVDALEVVSGQKYVAISHVWSDGLGNTLHNSLPTCQLLRLREITAAIYKTSGSSDSPQSVYPSIWIDTLCVPLEKSARKLALVRLAESYAAADTVLVLDGELQETSINCCQEEQLLRICLSQWLRRLWTLEEGIIGRAKVRFQLQEASIEIPQVKGDAFQPIGENAMALIQYCLPTVDNKINDKNSTNLIKQNAAPNIVSILMATQFRSTTKMIDESLCLGHILGLNATDLVAEPSEPQRMRKFLLMLAGRRVRLPSTFLFTTEPKLQIDGFRWAPASFMSLYPGDVHNLIEQQKKAGAYFNERGIQSSNLIGYELDFGLDILKKVVFFKSNDIWHVAVPVPSRGFSLISERYWTKEMANEAMAIEPERDWPEGWRSVYHTSPTDMVLLGTSIGPGSGRLAVSKYSFDYDNDENMLYARVIGLVTVFPLRAIEFKGGREVVVDEELALGAPIEAKVEFLRKRNAMAFKEEFSEKTCSLAVVGQSINKKAWCIG